MLQHMLLHSLMLLQHVLLQSLLLQSLLLLCELLLLLLLLALLIIYGVDPVHAPAELLRPRHATARSNYNFFTRRPRPPVPTTGPARRQPSRIVCDHNWPCPTWPARNRREHIHVAGSYEGGSSPPQQ